MKIVAHRGASAIAPENTLIAFRRAFELGADSIELDVHMSADGLLVVHHDYELGHPDNGKGLISSSRWDYINTLDAGKWFSDDYEGEKIPLLDDVFSAFDESAQFEIELKGSTLEFLSTVIDLVESRELFSRIEFTSPHEYILFHLKNLKPEAKIGLFFSDLPEWMSKKLGEKLIKDKMCLTKATVAHLPLKVISQNLMKSLQSDGFLVHASDINTESDHIALRHFECDQLSTDDVKLAVNMRL